MEVIVGGLVVAGLLVLGILALMLINAAQNRSPRDPPDDG